MIQKEESSVKKIMIFNQKGGVGKSTITANLAGCLEKYHRKKVLVIDCDAQSNVSSYLTAIGEENGQYNTSNNLCDFLEGKIDDIGDIIYNYKRISGKNLLDTKIDVIPAGMRLDEVDIADIYVLKSITDMLEKRYDICLFDCPPQKTEIAKCALAVSDYVIVPAQADIDSVQGWRMVVDLVDKFRNEGINKHVYLLGLVLNEYSKNGALDKYMMNVYNELFGDYVFKSTIRSSKAIKQARFFGKTICDYKKSSIQEDFEDLAKEVLKKIK